MTRCTTCHLIKCKNSRYSDCFVCRKRMKGLVNYRNATNLGRYVGLQLMKALEGK